MHLKNTMEGKRRKSAAKILELNATTLEQG
jgi:hypothetical protein